MMPQSSVEPAIRLGHESLINLRHESVGPVVSTLSQSCSFTSRLRPHIQFH
jgi:hypothetical protein